MSATDKGGIPPHVALMLGEEPLMKRETMRDKRKELRLTRLAKQYIIDFDITKACARAGLEWSDVKHAEREPFFIALVQELLETIEPDLVMSRQEVLMAFKREAFTAAKGSERIKALEHLARLLGMELPDPSKKSSDSAPPTINITLTTGPKA